MSDTTSVNDQILDAVQALAQYEGKDSSEFTIALARQALAQAVVMAVQNAVAAQQRNYLLQQAITTINIKRAFEVPAEEALKMIESHLAGNDIVDTIRQLKTLLDELDSKGS